MAPESKISKNYIFGGVVALLVLVVVILLIRDEARRTREQIDKLGREAPKGMKDAAKEGAKELPEIVLGGIADILRGEPDGQEGGEQKGNKSKRIRPQEVVSDAFEFGRDSLKSADDIAQKTFALDLEEELEIGHKLHQLMLDNQKPADAPAKLERIRKLAKPILDLRKRKGVPYTFTLIDDPDVNARSLPGGYIYLNTGLVDFVKTDAELQSVLAHEIGHVDLKHSIRCMTFAVRASEFTGKWSELPLSVVYRLYELAFTEEFEFEADAYAFRRLVKLGRSSDEALSFLRRLMEYLKTSGIEIPQRKPNSVPAAVKQELVNHFRTHPPTEERLKRLEALPLADAESRKKKNNAKKKQE